MSINLHLSSAESERLAGLLAWASEHLSDEYTSDPDLRALAPIAERVLELVEAETVEGMIERGEIEQGALANSWQALHYTLGDLGRASVTLPHGQPVKVHVELGPHVQFVHLNLWGEWWLYCTPDWNDDGTIAIAVEHQETTDIPLAWDIPAEWTGDLDTDLATYGRLVTEAVAKAVPQLRRHIAEEGASDCPSYTCPKCHRGVMQCATNHGDGWASMECPDCGHTEQTEVDQ